MKVKRSNAEIKLHNLKGELKFLLRLNPDFQKGYDFLIDSIDRCAPGREQEMHDKIKDIIHHEHEKIKNGISPITG